MPSRKISVSVSDKEIPVLTFPGGMNLTTDARKRKLTVSAYKAATQKDAKKRRKKLVVESQSMTYIGDNYGTMSAENGSTDLYVVEVDKATDQMTLYPSEMFHLLPVTQGDVHKDDREKSMTFQEKTDMLEGAFGSKRQKTAVERRQWRKTKAASETSAMMAAVDVALTSHQQHSEWAESESQESGSAIPPYNKDALSPAEVYELCHILGQAEMDSLTKLAEDFKNCSSATLKEWTDKKEYELSVLSRLKLLPVGEKAREERAILLLYLHYMLTLYHYKYDQIRKRDPLPAAWPDPVKHMMLERFTVKTGGQRRLYPARKKDLLLSHILVLCLTMDGFTTPLDDLLRDLKVTPNKLYMHARALGCTVKKTASGTVGARATSFEAVLKVPFTLPEPPKKRQKKR